MDRTQLFFELKRQLKNKKVRYAQLAEFLDLSESSVKRIFSSANCTLTQLEKICQFTGIDFENLILSAKARAAVSFQLPIETEEQLAKHIETFLFYRALVIEKDFTAAQKRRKLPLREARRFGKKLEQLGLITVMPEDKIRFVRPGLLKLREGGPLQKALYRHWLPGFVEDALENNMQDFRTKLFSTTVSKEEIDRFYIEYTELVEQLLKKSQVERLVKEVPQLAVTVAFLQGPRRIGD